MKTVATRLALEITLITAITLGIWSGIAQANPNPPTIPPAIPAAPEAAAAPATTPDTQPTSQTVAVRAVVLPHAAVPVCNKGTLPSPAALSLNLNQSGVTKVIDAPSYYKVYGNSIAEVKAQIAKCSPVENGRYAAITVSNLNWQFAYYRDPWSNLCKLSNVAVGVHTSFLYPSWNTPNQAWQTFMDNTVAHEQGHAELANIAANAIVTDLQNIPFTDCSSIVNTANNLANARVNALDHDNATYDMRTNHGATQGANL